MPKKLKNMSRMTGPEYFEHIKFTLEDKYFNLWLKKFEFEGDEIDHRKNRYILMQYYNEGRVAAFRSIAESLEFAQFNVQGYDLYNEPIKAQLINTRQSPLIPRDIKYTDKEDGYILSYILDSHNSPRKTVMTYIEEIALTKVIIRTNLYSHSMPFILALSPADQKRVQEILNNVLAGELSISADFSDIDKIKVLNGGATFIIDKLYKYKTDIENELKTYLGLNNTGVEKKERMLDDEVNANNEEIATQKDSWIKPMEDMCERIKKYLGFNITVKSIAPPMEDFSSDESRAGKHLDEEEE